MNASETRIGPWTIRVEQEMIPVRDDYPSIDKDWRFIDASGHGHFWQKGYPTLKVVEVECFCSAVDEDHTVSHFECPHCGDAIVPGMKPPTLMTRMERGALMVTLTFDDGTERREYQLSEADGRAVLADPVSAIPRVTADLQPTVREFGRW